MSEVLSGMVIDGKYTLSSGMVLEDATVSPGGVLSAMAGGTATNLTVEDGASLHMAVAPDTLVQGTSAGVAFSNSDGYLSGYVHEPTSITRIAVSSGGTAVDITCVEGWINVSKGGLLSSSYVSSTGRLGLNGGDAIDVTVEAGAQFFVTVGEGTNLDIISGGKRIVAENGVIDGIAADGSASAWYYITSGGSAINTVGNNMMWLAVSAGYASNTILRASGNPTGTNRARLDLRSGGVTEDTFIYAGGSMSVSNGQSIASDTHIYQGGILDLTGKAAAEGADMHPYAKDTYVHSGGTMLIKQNTVVTGELRIEEGATVSLTGSAATLDFDVTNRSTADAALYNNYSLITGAANAQHTITVSSSQSMGTYQLAAGAAEFAATVTVNNAEGALGTLTAGDSFTVDSTKYSLNLNGDALSLRIAEVTSGLVIDGTYNLSSGMPELASATVVAGGMLYVYSGGVATDLTVEDGASLYMAVAPDTIVQGTSAGVAFSNSNGYLSGYVHEPDKIAARIAISSGGTAVDITCNEGWVNVSQGGLLSSSHIASTGRLGLNGGDALDVTVDSGAYFFITIASDTDLDITSGGKRIVASDGVLDGMVADGVNSTWIYVTSGGSVTNTQGSNKTWIALSGGYGANTVLSGSGNPTGTNRARMDVRSGGVAENTYIYAGGSMSVSNGWSLASKTYIYNGGIMDMVSKTNAEGDVHFYAKDTYVFSGGTMYVKQAGVVTGELQIEEGATVSLTGSAVTLDFDVTNRSTADAALYNNYSLIRNAANAQHTITVSSTQAKGTYQLAAGAADFAATVTVNSAEGALGTLTAGDSFTVDSTKYSLNLNGDALSLRIAEVTSGMTIDGTYRLSAGMPDLANATVVGGGYLQVYSGGVATDLTVEEGASLYMVVAPNTIVQGTSAGMAFNNSNGYLSGYVHEPVAAARIVVSSGGTAVDITCNESWINVSKGGLLSSSYITSYGRLGLNGGDAVDVTLESGAYFFFTVASDTNLDITSGGSRLLVSNGVLDDFTADGANTVMAYVTEGASALNVTGNDYFWMANSTGYTSNVVLKANQTGFNGARMDVRLGGVTEATTISRGGSMAVYNADTVVSNTRIYDGGILNLASATAAEGADAHFYAKDTFVHSGGTMLIKQNAVVTGELQIEAGATVTLTGATPTLDFDLTNRSATDAALYNNYSLITGAAKANHTVTVSGQEADGRYQLAAGAADYAAETAVVKASERLGTVVAGSALVADHTGYVMQLTGGALSMDVQTLAEAAAAESLGGAVLANGDRAAYWGGNTTAASGSVYLAGDLTSGGAWLELDGYQGSDTALYGATGSTFAAGDVYINMSSGVIRNLAAGADAAGAVRKVDLRFGDGATVTGGVYAGGFGSVATTVDTRADGGAFVKDFYAGALANYAKTQTATSLGDVNLTVNGGTFSGNIYGASAVKMGTQGGVLAHTVGDISITLAGGEAANSKFSLFGGGYATGSTASTTAVYKTDGVTIDVAGGDWGSANGGRGIFGGAFASLVTAQVADVEITVSGGKVGNVYGGGWAQKQGVSQVAGDVDIVITGGTVGNVHGGGCHSTSGGSTSVGGVNITISGGDITGDVFARGQMDGDTVTGDALVTFTGARNFNCGVYGYGAANAEGRAELSFAEYTGAFAGAIGGFDGVEFSGATAMKLTAAADAVANSDWKFDVSERAEKLAGTALLDWSNADFAGDTITLNLAEGSTSEWNLVRAATVDYGSFDVQIDSISQGTLALGEKLADGDFAGWGFAVEDSVLKFKNLA